MEKEKKKNPFKYTVFVIVMFIIGAILGYIFSNMRNSKNESSAIISRERAKEIALEDAKKDFSKEVSLDTDIYIETDKDIYEVSFYVGGLQYKYEIRMSDGVILDKKWSIPMNTNGSTNTSVVSLERAKKTVLEDANLKEQEVTFLNHEQEHDYHIYEIEFYTNDKEYEYEVNSSTGNILNKKVELRNKHISNSSNQITMDEAQSIALKDANLSLKDATFLEEISIVREEYNFYKIEFLSANKKYEYEIELSTGTILESSWKLR